MHVTYFSYLKPRPPLATVDPPDQTEWHVASRQCAEASGRRVSSSRDSKGSISAANGGERIFVTFFFTCSVFRARFSFRQKLARPKRPGKLVNGNFGHECRDTTDDVWHQTNPTSWEAVRGWLYATRMKSYNPLFRIVANIVWYIIVHVGDFILSLLRLYLWFFRTFIYGFLHTWGLGGNLLFSDLGIFCCSIQRVYTNSHKSLILFYGSFLNFGTNSYTLIHTINLQIV